MKNTLDIEASDLKGVAARLKRQRNDVKFFYCFSAFSIGFYYSAVVIFGHLIELILIDIPQARSLIWNFQTEAKKRPPINTANCLK
ncbi:hypothetical protein JCGZ_15254 [Jatropha curcas]|uniref:Uncharacterized protein n=1 Tax=Jatropha curcas TaxID=180498 RepID=A0A067KE62_JATCU|nr:hypothetical protein JCGZ_15254 [Jatropha curcas]